MKTALITGASSGLGKAFKEALQGKYHLILIGRNFQTIEEDTIIYDLTKDLEDLFTKLDSFTIDLFINNAGIGSLGYSEDIESLKDEEMVDLNIKALILLTKYALSKKIPHIVNVSSIGSVLPGPFINTYYASKSFVLRYSMNLIYEGNKGISILLPGPLKTNFNHRNGLRDDKNAMDPKKYVEKVYPRIMKNKAIILVGFGAHMAYFGSKFLPKRFLAKLVLNSQKKKLIEK